jgi:hypothetical protein
MTAFFPSSRFIAISPSRDAHLALVAFIHMPYCISRQIDLNLGK